MTVERAIEMLEVNKKCVECDSCKCIRCDNYEPFTELMANENNFADALSMGIEALKKSLPELSKEEIRMTRSDVLEEAKKCVCEGRENLYGEPEDNFKKIAQLWSAYCDDIIDFDEKDVAIMMILMKVARASSGINHADNFVDIAGYAACAGEIETKDAMDEDDEL